MEDKTRQDIDKAIIAKVLSGDTAAFMQLYNYYKGRILAHLYNYIGDYQKAEDLCQEAFLSAYTHLNSFTGEGKFSSWLYQIASNAARDELRRRKKRKTDSSLEAPIKTVDSKEITLGDVIPDNSLRPDIEPRQKELEAHILGVVGALPDIYRDVLLLCDIQNLRYEEVAKILSCGVGTVGFRLHQARDMFKKKMKLKFGDLNFYIRMLKPVRQGINKMLCPIIKYMLSFYIDKECSIEAAKMIEHHLELCPGCYEKMVSLQETVIILGQINSACVPSADLDLAFEQKLMLQGRVQSKTIALKDRINTLKQKIDILIPKAWAPIQLPILVPVRAIASIILVLFLSIALFHTQIGYLPHTTVISGKTFIYQARTGQKTDLTSGIKLAKGDTIFVDKGFVDFELDGKYLIRLKENTNAVVNKVTRSRIKGATRFTLEKGTMLVKTKKDFIGSDLQITTPTGIARVHGTAFMLIADKTSTEVLVKQGTVMFASHYGKDRPELVSTVLVDANYKVITKSNNIPGLPATLTDAEAYALTELDNIGHNIQLPLYEASDRLQDISNVRVVLALSLTSQRVRELFVPYSMAIKGTGGRKTVIHELVGESMELAKQAHVQKNKKMLIASMERLEQIVKDYPNSKNDPQILIYIGSYYEQRSMHDMAIRAFQKVADNYPFSEWASLAQCAIGIIYEEKLQDHVKAKQAYNAVFIRYPDTLEIHEAKSGLSRLK